MRRLGGLLLPAALLLAAPAWAEGTNTPAAPIATAAPAAQPEFDYAIANGYYATVTAMSGITVPEAPAKEQRIKLKDVEGFKQSAKVRMLLQPGRAPLAVLLLGLTTDGKAPLAKLWQAQLYEAGCHVLTFDSVFRPSFNSVSRHGVPGHLETEALVVDRLVAALLKDPAVAGKVSEIGLLGASYGGMLALNYAILAEAGKTSVKPSRVLVFSPPVSMRSGSRLLDDYAEKDRPQFTLTQLGKLGGHRPVAAGEAVPFSDSLMRGGIGYMFRQDIEEAAESAQELYGKSLPPEPVRVGGGGSYEEGRRIFTRYVEHVAYPYWREQGKVRNLDELWAMGDLRQLLPRTPAGVAVCLAADDPLNEAKELEELRGLAPAGRLKVLPRGGHLGFVSSRWAKARVQALFK